MDSSESRPQACPYVRTVETFHGLISAWEEPTSKTKTGDKNDNDDNLDKDKKEDDEGEIMRTAEMLEAKRVLDCR